MLTCQLLTQELVIQTTLDTPCSLWVIPGTYSENCFGKKSWFAGRVLIETTVSTAEDPLHVLVANKDGSFLYVLHQKGNKFPMKYCCYQGTQDVIHYRCALGGHCTPNLAINSRTTTFLLVAVFYAEAAKSEANTIWQNIHYIRLSWWTQKMKSCHQFIYI